MFTAGWQQNQAKISSMMQSNIAFHIFFFFWTKSHGLETQFLNAISSTISKLLTDFKFQSCSRCLLKKQK